MQRRRAVLSSAILICGLALALTGCSSSTTATRKIVRIPFRSAAIHGNTIPAIFTCDGKDISPPMEWGAVPSDTVGLALFVVGFTPQGTPNVYRANVDWAVSGLSPSLHKIAAGQLPHEAFVGLAADHKRNYSVCPKHGVKERYQFELYGLPAGLSLSREFAGLSVLEDLARSNTGSPINSWGGFAANYTRK